MTLGNVFFEGIDDFDIILVVTHIDDLRDSFPVHLVVQKTGDGSYVSVR